MSAPARTAVDIARQCDLDVKAMAGLSPDAAPSTLVDALAQAGKLDEAVTFVAHWLEKPAAVWWGCLCCWHALRPTPPANLEEALVAIVAWLGEPSEERRRGMESLYLRHGARIPVGMLAYASFCSRGSIAPENATAMPADPLLTAQLVAGAVQLAAWSRADAADTLRLFIRLGLEVANGKNRWE
jgi:hypothetical protein